MKARLSRVAAAVLTLLIPATVLARSARPEAGTDPAIDLRSVPEVVAYGDGLAIPLAAARPAWYTNELEAQVLAAPG